MRPGGAGRAARTAPLERPLGIDGQAQYSDHDYQHDGQSQSRSHSWILGHDRSAFTARPSPGPDRLHANDLVVDG
jgi:hypothetical protein